MRDSITAIEAFLLHPFVALAVAVVFLVISWRLGGDTSNAFLIVAWALLALAVFRTIHANVPLVLRCFWTMLSAAIMGLVLYPLRYYPPKADTKEPSAPASAMPTAAEIAAEVAKHLPKPDTVGATDHAEGVVVKTNAYPHIEASINGSTAEIFLANKTPAPVKASV